MRHSAAHLAIALCTTMAVSSAPVSPNPISPALVTPLMNSENQALDVNEKAQRSPPQKRSVGGFAYHELDQSEFDKRAIASPSENGVQAESFAPSDSDDGFSSGFESDSDNDVGAASDTEIQRRSIPEIWTRSPPPSPQQEAADASGFDDNASDALADDNLSDMSDDDNFSVASDFGDADMDDPSNSSEFGDADMEDPSGKAQSEATETVAGEENEKTKIEARGIDVGSQSERLGGRNYIDANSWTA